MKSLSPLLLIFLFAACDGMKTELDVDSIAFPPKLSVTAILDNEEGTFSIAFSEGRALADYAKPFLDNREITRDGEIRLYEDDRLIWSQQGPFDMSMNNEQGLLDDGNWYYFIQNGYAHVEYGIVSCTGSEYRLEVEVEGYETVVSTATMPDAPVVTAKVDASTDIEKNNVHTIYSLNSFSWYGNYVFWPLTVHFTDLDLNERKYYAMDIAIKTDEYLDGVIENTLESHVGIGVSELSKLQDNPDVETEGVLIDTNPPDLYLFTMLLQSNVTFSRGENVLNYFAGRPQNFNISCSDYDLSSNYVQITFREYYSLRVKRITIETFKYYRSLSLQSAGMGFLGEPVTVTGNMNKGYGCFSVINSVKIPLAELEGCFWRPDYGN